MVGNKLKKKLQLDPLKPFDCFNQREASQAGKLEVVTTLFLVGAECPFQCSMCDLWKYTLDSSTQVGAIPRQIELGLRQVEELGDWVKLYNASNFFDPRAIPWEDHPAIADQCRSFKRVIVECHPKLLLAHADRILDFRDRLSGKLEIAMGLESVDPRAIALLNKSMSLELFRRAVEWCSDHQIDTRSFVILQPPGTAPSESVDWAVESVKKAFHWGCRHSSLIPLRGGNATTDNWLEQGLHQLPNAFQFESAVAKSLNVKAREDQIFCGDLWDWNCISGTCETCRDWRRARIEYANLTQLWPGGSPSAIDRSAEIACECRKWNNGPWDRRPGTAS